MPYYQIFNFLASNNPTTRGLCLRLICNMKATEVEIARLNALAEDNSEIVIHEKGLPITTTVAEMARAAIAARAEEDGE